MLYMYIYKNIIVKYVEWHNGLNIYKTLDMIWKLPVVDGPESASWGPS